MIPGEIIPADGTITLNEGRETVTLTVANTGDRPFRSAAITHFFETNPALSFDRAKARGFRLDIASGTAVRFEPGQSREVTLVRWHRTVYGFRGDGQARLRVRWFFARRCYVSVLRLCTCHGADGSVRVHGA